MLNLLRTHASYRKGPAKADAPCWYARDEQAFISTVLAQQHSGDADMQAMVRALSALQVPAAEPLVLPQQPVEAEQGPLSPTPSSVSSVAAQHHAQSIVSPTIGQASQRYTDLRQLIDERKALRHRCLACEQESAHADPCWQSSAPHNTQCAVCWYA